MPSRTQLAWMSLTCRSLYPFVLWPLAQVPRERRNGYKVIDLPSGTGVLTRPLAAAGFTVIPSDLFPEYYTDFEKHLPANNARDTFSAMTEEPTPDWLARDLFGPTGKAPNISGLKPVAADMEATLPFSDADRADALLCVEGIEHVKDRHAVLTELRRHLKPGGRLILTTPNLLSVRARLAYCFAGQRAFKSYIDEHTSVWGRSADGSRIYHGHAFLVSYFQVRYSLHHCGYKVKALHPSNWSLTSIVLLPLMWPLIALGTLVSQKRAKKKFAKMKAKGEIPADAEPPYKEMFSHLLSLNLLLNATLIMEAEAV